MPSPASLQLQNDRLALRERSQTARESATADKHALDVAHLSLLDQGNMIRKAATIEQLTFRRATLQNEYSKRMSSAAAISALSQLDPRSASFHKDSADIMAKNADAFGSVAVQKVLNDKRADAVNYQKAEHDRVLSTFTEPLAAKAYSQAYANTNDPVFANKVAEATAGQVTKAKTLAVSTDLSPEDRASLYDPAKGTFNLANVGKLEMKASAAKALRAPDDANLKTLDVLTKTIAHLKGVDGLEVPPELTQALHDYSAKLGKPLTASGPSSGTVDSEVSRLIGKPGSAPAAPVAATPEQPAEDDSADAEPDETVGLPEE